MWWLTVAWETPRTAWISQAHSSGRLRRRMTAVIRLLSESARARVRACANPCAWVTSRESARYSGTQQLASSPVSRSSRGTRPSSTFAPAIMSTTINTIYVDGGEHDIHQAFSAPRRAECPCRAHTPERRALRWGRPIPTGAPSRIARALAADVPGSPGGITSWWRRSRAVGTIGWPIHSVEGWMWRSEEYLLGECSSGAAKHVGARPRRPRSGSQSPPEPSHPRGQAGERVGDHRPAPAVDERLGRPGRGVASKLIARDRSIAPG